MGNLTERGREISVRCLGLVVFPIHDLGGFRGRAVFAGAATFCLQCASSLGREKGQWDTCQMASSVTH